MPMTRAEFVDAHKHEVCGIVMDALMGGSRNGGELALLIRSLMQRVDAKLARAYDDLITNEPAKPAAQPPQGKRTP